jgi:hypothetical protein
LIYRMPPYPDPIERKVLEVQKGVRGRTSEPREEVEEVRWVGAEGVGCNALIDLDDVVR